MRNKSLRKSLKKRKSVKKSILVKKNILVKKSLKKRKSIKESTCVKKSILVKKSLKKRKSIKESTRVKKSKNIDNGKDDDEVLNGDEYESDVVNGERTLTLSNSDKHEGNFVNDEYNGKGTYTYANGDKYEGNFVNGKFNGKGTHTYTNGDKYEGNYVDGKFHGKGTATYANGDKYEGNFVDGEFHGKGTLTYANGDKYKGNFENNVLILLKKAKFNEMDYRKKYIYDEVEKNGLLTFKENVNCKVKKCEGIMSQDNFDEFKFTPNGTITFSNEIKTIEIGLNGICLIECQVCYKNNAYYLKDCKHIICEECCENITQCHICRRNLSKLIKFIE